MRATALRSASTTDRWVVSALSAGHSKASGEDVDAVDAVLLTHDHHADNLDDAGRAYLANAGVIVTTTSSG